MFNKYLDMFSWDNFYHAFPTAQQQMATAFALGIGSAFIIAPTVLIIWGILFYFNRNSTSVTTCTGPR